MGEKKIIKVAKKTDTANAQNTPMEQASLESQCRLAEILNDSPRLVSLNGTEWEVRALRMGTQWLIAQRAADVLREESKTFGDIIRQFSLNIPAILDVLTLCLLNDRFKIFKDGKQENGYSELYYATRRTLEWDCDVAEFGNILLECLQLLSVDFFLQSKDILEIFRMRALEKKRMRIAGQK